MADYEVPEDLFYHKEHEWVSKPDSDGMVTIGVTDFAQKSLTDVVYAGFKVDEGDEIEFEQVVAEVESVKSVSDIYTPVAGEVIAINNELEDEPEKVNQEPYNAWFIKIKVKDFDADKTNLMDAAKYKEYCASL